MAHTGAVGAMLVHRYGYDSLPLVGRGKVELAPVASPGINTGTVRYVPLQPDPSLSLGAIEGIREGFDQFLQQHRRLRRRL